MCFKARTRLRAFACFLTYMGLTIAVVGLLRAQQLVNPNWFWAWNFMAEGLAVVALCLTVVSVGTGFYPMTKDRNWYWRLSMGVVVSYAMAATGVTAYYVQQKLVHHFITAEQIQQLREQIIDEGISTAEGLLVTRLKEQYKGIIPPGDTGITGASSWTVLSWPEREMFARPSKELYLAHQFAMLGTCMCVVLYLFIPLVRHHRHGPVVRPVDSDMVAIGVWYLTCLMTLATFYGTLNIIYCVWQVIIFKQQAQALDLCLRITIGPIFFIPAPKPLLQFYRDRFQRFKGNGSSGRNDSATGQTRSSERSRFGSNNITSTTSSTKVGSARGTRNDSIPRGSLDIKYQEPTSPSGAFSRIRMFGRERCQSVESNRVLNKDFECDSAESQHTSEGRPESYHQRYSSLDINHHPLRNSMVLHQQSEGKPFKVDELQQPKPVLTEQHIRTARINIAPSTPDMELMPISPVHGIDTKTGDEGHSPSNMQVKVANENPREGNKTQINKGPVNHTLADVDTPFENLTGLQRQLAEHRSALLPKVIAFKAYHDDLATGDSFDYLDSNELHRRPSRSRPSKSFRRQVEDDSAVFNISSSPSQSGGVEPDSVLSSHIADSVIRSTAIVPPKYLPDGIDNANNSSTSKPRDSKLKDGLKSAFSRIASSNDDNNDKNNSHVDASPETDQGPIAVEDLTHYSGLGIDPYDSRIEFKRAVEITSPSGPKSPSSSIDSKGVSAPSLGSHKSRDSLSKSSVDSKDSQKGSKVLGSPKSSSSSSRKVRSKSDGAQQQEKSHVPRTPPVDLPSTFSRPLPELPSVTPSPVVKASLPPPPRQSWQRSKSSKNSVPTLATTTSIDANQTNESDPTTGNTLSSASDANYSSSSSQSSPTNVITSSEIYPQRTMGSINQSQDYRGYSQEYNIDSRMSRERERTTPLSPSTPGFNTRMSNNSHQRSVDNLASAYYYKRASELNNSASGRSSTFTTTSQYKLSPTQSSRQIRDSNNGRSSTFTSTSQFSHVSPTQSSRQIREPNGIAIPSSLHSSAMSPTLGSPPSNIRSLTNVSGYVDSYGYGASGRDSPSPTFYGRGGSSPSMSTAEQNGTYFNNSSTSESKSNSFTNSYGSQTRRQSRLLGDDPWTLAMVNRAQAQSASTKPSMD
ncbi:hypothetical protein BGZ79_009887 [Entomortierella chlamydospora]|nr:hypothetical protein BGZ79_009887 [Entomortierella chlamydospora]